MRFVNEANVGADPERTWAMLGDIPRVASCVPGVEGVEALDASRYAGLLRVSLGPVRLALTGELQVVARDDEARAQTLEVNAADAGAGGAVKAQVRIAARPNESGGTRVTIETDAQVMGRIGEFGQPIIKRKADQMMTAFSANLARALAETDV
jgi:carbon monoxide dehydrogenase subunit G